MITQRGRRCPAKILTVNDENLAPKIDHGKLGANWGGSQQSAEIREKLIAFPKSNFNGSRFCVLEDESMDEDGSDAIN